MIQTFRKSISDSEHLCVLYHYCVDEQKLPGDYGDLLRMAFIYCMSALDKLAHDILTHYMVEIFVGRRSPTRKYLTETISMENQIALAGATMPPKEIIFEGMVRTKLAYQSFMDPDKLVDALSLVWQETHKWQKIATTMRLNPEQASTELKNLCKRRNAIVHETDWDPITDQKMPILSVDARRAADFVSLLGETIHTLVV